MKLFTVCGIFVGFLLHVSSDDTFTLADLNPQQGTDKQRSWHEIFKLKDLKGNRKAPEFMMELYDAVAESNGTLKNTNLLDGNVVRSFEGQSSGSYHFFNLTSFRPDERVIKAEFRWPRPTRPYTGHHDFYKVDLHEVLDSTAKPWRGNLISSRLLPVNTKGWEIFNITQMVIKRIRNSGTKDRILVVVASPSDNLLESSIYGGHSDERNAYLVVYSDDRQQNNQNPVFYKGPVRRPVASAVRRRRSGRPFTPTCQRTNLYVDFTKIGWSGWIISPRGYNAYSCAGSCPFPLGEGLRATNHATVRSIMNALKLMPETGKPCCVPDVLQPISLLYFDDEENVVLKKYDDMVAGDCGCH